MSSIDLQGVMRATSHDANSSLDMMFSCIDEAYSRYGEETESCRKLFAQLAYEAYRMGYNMNVANWLYRLENNEIQLSHDSVDVAWLIEDQVNRLSSYLTYTDIELLVEGDDSLIWELDESLVGDIIRGALHNACRYAKERVSISYVEVGDELVITIEDDSGGYPQFALDALAQEDFQLDMVDGHSGGLNMAVYFAKKALEMHCQRGAKSRLIATNSENAGVLKMVFAQ